MPVNPFSCTTRVVSIEHSVWLCKGPSVGNTKGVNLSLATLSFAQKPIFLIQRQTLYAMFCKPIKQSIISRSKRKLWPSLTRRWFVAWSWSLKEWNWFAFNFSSIEAFFSFNIKVVYNSLSVGVGKGRSCIVANTTISMAGAPSR